MRILQATRGNGRWTRIKTHTRIPATIVLISLHLRRGQFAAARFSRMHRTPVGRPASTSRPATASTTACAARGPHCESDHRATSSRARRRAARCLLVMRLQCASQGVHDYMLRIVAPRSVAVGSSTVWFPPCRARTNATSRYPEPFSSLDTMGHWVGQIRGAGWNTATRSIFAPADAPSER